MSIMENQMEKKSESELQTGCTIDPAFLYDASKRWRLAQTCRIQRLPVSIRVSYLVVLQ